MTLMEPTLVGCPSKTLNATSQQTNVTEVASSISELRAAGSAADTRRYILGLNSSVTSDRCAYRLTVAHGT